MNSPDKPSHPAPSDMESEASFRSDVKARLRALNRALGEIHGLNKAQIAERLGVQPSAVTNWESNRTLQIPEQYRLWLYKRRFDVSTNWLTDGDMSKMPYDLATAVQRHLDEN